MDLESTTKLNEIAPKAVESIKDYFDTGSDTATSKANMALKVLSRINGNDANRIKLLALQFSIARHAGLKGQSLQPLLSELNPALSAPKLEAVPESKSNEGN
jgi:hypothetical protein